MLRRWNLKAIKKRDARGDKRGKLRLPTDTQHLAIMGATGTGKTQAAVWHLSLRSYDTMPWLVYNFKNDEIVDGIPHARHIQIDELPIRPGVYIVHPLPSESDIVEAQMWAVWQRGRYGVYVDEGYMVDRTNSAFSALLTQGRSKHIPIITLTQRPAWITRFVFTESSYFQVFRLQHKDDRKAVEAFVPADLSKRLPPFNSYYYDVQGEDGQGKVTRSLPVPALDTIYHTFHSRLKGQPHVI